MSHVATNSKNHKVREKASYAAPPDYGGGSQPDDESCKFSTNSDSECYHYHDWNRISLANFHANMKLHEPKNQSKISNFPDQPLVVVAVPRSTQPRLLAWTDSERPPTAPGSRQSVVPLNQLPGAVCFDDLPSSASHTELSYSKSQIDEYVANDAANRIYSNSFVIDARMPRRLPKHPPKADRSLVVSSSTQPGKYEPQWQSQMKDKPRTRESVGGATVEVNVKPDWRKNRDLVEKSISRYAEAVAFCGMVGILASSLQHEAVLVGVQPDSGYIDLLKVVNSLISLLILIMLYRLHVLKQLFHRIRQHLHLLMPLNVNISACSILCKPAFWLEVLVCCVHVPPFVTFEVPVTNWGNFVLYRAETLGAVWGTLRLYLVWLCIRDRFLGTIPRRHTIAHFTGISLDSGFTLKQMLNGPHALQGICATWTSLLFLSGYWMRAAECTACQFGSARHVGCLQENAHIWIVHSSVGSFVKVNDPYLWNWVWVAFSTSTTVGYGDMHVSTMLARGISFATSISGLFLLALLTSTFMLCLEFTPKEVTASLMIDRARAESTLMQRAATFLSAWWRFRKLGGSYLQALHRARGQEEIMEVARLAGKLGVCRFRLHMARSAFSKALRSAHVDMDDLHADQVKIDQIALRSRHLVGAASALHACLEQSGDGRSISTRALDEWLRKMHTWRPSAFDAAASMNNTKRDVSHQAGIRIANASIQKVLTRAYIKKYTNKKKRI